MQTTPLSQQRGATIFEILVSVLILSFGILALVGLQARSLSAAGDAKYRIEATNYADQIIGQMWADRNNIANYPTFVAPEAAAWRAQVLAGLPGATAPTITVTGAIATGTLVSVTVRWMPPGHPAGAPANNVVVQTRIDNP